MRASAVDFDSAPIRDRTWDLWLGVGGAASRLRPDACVGRSQTAFRAFAGACEYHAYAWKQELTVYPCSRAIGSIVTV